MLGIVWIDEMEAVKRCSRDKRACNAYVVLIISYTYAHFMSNSNL